MTNGKRIEDTFELFTLEEMEEMAFRTALAKMLPKGASVSDFLEKNNVTYRSAFRPKVGVAVVIGSVTPKAPKSAPTSEEPS